MIFLLFIVIGAALGFFAAPRLQIKPVTGGALGAVGGLIGGIIIKFLFQFIVGFIGAAIGALILLAVYREYQKRQ